MSLRGRRPGAVRVSGVALGGGAAPELLKLPDELARVDAGWAAVDTEGTYLRLMFLKFRYRLGFESLCREVSDSISWRERAGQRVMFNL